MASQLQDDGAKEFQSIARVVRIIMATKSRSWKLERASVNKQGNVRPRSNKYSRSDSDRKPASRARQRVWVGGYTRADGSRVHGYYRSTPD